MTKEVLVKKLGDLFYYPKYRQGKYEVYFQDYSSDVLIIRNPNAESSLRIHSKNGNFHKIDCVNLFKDYPGTPNKLPDMVYLIYKFDGIKLLFT